MRVKYTADGHVVTVGSQLGHRVSLSIREGRVALSLTSRTGEGETEAMSEELQLNVFTSVVSKL